ncbi:hypothetical protein KY336_01315, partial [Candidatus Woesearchaeota archaeon]|nr:hypothetical protein [Candidatus Woesearchaeota archaeon]
IYVEFTEEQKNAFVDAYLKSEFRTDFIAAIVTHKKGNTIERLKNDVGNFSAYQKRTNKTLRSEFGLPKEYNIVSQDLTAVFNGLHKINDVKDFYKHLLLFDISWPA